MPKRLPLLLFLLFALLASATVQSAIRDDFPRPEAFDPDVAFWKRIYTEVGTDGGLLHDNRHLGVVYRVLSFPENADARQRSRVVDAAREEIRDGLLRLASNPEADDALSRELRELWGEGAGPAELRAAADRIRFQLGQRDRFLAGLERSGRWDAWIRQVMREHEVPEGMVALPHVESSFTPYARSRVGASGMWQFTRGTGQRFMQVDHVLDERLDPWLSSQAAAKLLRHNYQVTGSWPLALTAYNHGAAGVRRAVNIMESDDIVTLAREYQGRRFGFASRNFYPAFLAALEIHAEPDAYFENYQLADAESPNGLRMPAYIPVTDVAEALDLSPEVLRRYNPALLRPVWEGQKHVPRGYSLRLPRDVEPPTPDALFALIPEERRFAAQAPDRYHVLRRGETLSHVANRYGISVSELVRLNNLRSAHRVRAGQRLTLPGAQTVTVETAPEDGIYRVRRGDNLSVIAARFRTSVEALTELNELDNHHRIYPGQQLRVRAPSPSTLAEAPEAEPEAEPEADESLPEAAPELAADLPDEGALMAAARQAQEALEGSGATPEIESPGPQPLPETQPELAADPSDYAVSPDGRITLQWGETLGHHADWLNIPTQRLRDLNGLPFGRAVVAGQRLRLDFSRVQPTDYEQRRMDFHQARQQAYFEAYRIVGSREYTVSPGDSLWHLRRQAGGVPEWLIQQYNPDLEVDRLRPGQQIRLPEVEPRD